MIKFNKVAKSFDNHNVLDNITFEINEGECVAFVGQSGKGKTTILNIIGLLDNYTSGSYLLENREVNKLSNKEKTKLLRNRIGYIFQNFALIDDDTVLNNLMLSITTKENKDVKKKKIVAALKFVGLEDKIDKKIYQLSGKEQQRVVITRLLLKDSDIILADEPTGSLDLENAKQILTILNHFRKKNKTIIIVTHDERIANWCDRIIRL